jgi:hypothetical protein
MVEIPIDIIDILDYIEHSVRCLREGLLLEVSNSIANLFVYKVDGEKYLLRGKCMSSHTISHTYDFRFELSADYRQWNLCCACPAGIAGKCKHILAGLKSVER